MGAEALSRESSNEPHPGTLVAGKYRVERTLGRGGMGRVLAATNEATGKNVALKWILDPSSPQSASRFAREARAAGRIHHPNVVDVYDVVEHEGATCIVMELLRGETLASLLAREKKLPIVRALELTIEIARGIAAAHAAGVIHRDLKPANVFLCAEEGGPDVKILDFGISKLVEADPNELTDTGVVLGTPQYLAPEQVRSASDVDHRVDVYALGAVLYEMLGGRPPHQHAHIPALLVEIATVAPRPVALLRPEVSSTLSELVGRAIAKDRDARFPSAVALIAALRHELGLSDETPRSPSALELDTLDPARPLARNTPPTAETALDVARPTPAETARSGTRETRRATSPWTIAAVALALAGVIALVWSQRAPTPAIQTPAPIASEVPRRAPDPPPTTITALPPPETDAPVDLVPRPRPTTTRRGSTTRPLASMVEVEVPPTALPPPTTIATPPSSSTPPPRAGRLGLDDL